MHEIYELKEMLMNELKEYGKKGEMSSGSLEVVDKLSHTIKNLCKIIEAYEEEGYSGAYGGGSYDGGSYARNNGRSYARGRRNSRRGANQYGSYAMDGGYSSAADEMIQELRDIMETAPDNRTKQEFQTFIRKLEQM